MEDRWVKRMQAVIERLSAPFARGSAPPVGPRKRSERWLVERITVAPLQGTVTLNASVTVCQTRRRVQKKAVPCLMRHGLLLRPIPGRLRF